MLFGESPPRIQNVMPGESSPSPRIQIVSFGESSPLILEWAYETRPNTPIITGARPTEPAALAGRYEALLKPAAGSSPASLGWIQAHVTPTGAFSGSVTVEGTRLPVSGILAPDGLARFRPAMTPDLELATGQGPARRSLGFLSMAGTPSGLSGALRDAGNALLASFAGERAPFGRANPVPDELLNLPASGKRTRGVYHVVFAPRETDGSNSPTGYGFARLTLSRSGMAALGGYLADGSRFTASGRLRADRSLACVQWLSGNQGAFGGELAFDPSAADTDLTGADWLWVRPMLRQARNYPDGWPDGVRLDVVGTKHAAPASLDLGQGPVRPNGNVGLEFREGRLLGAKNFAVNVDPSTGLVSRVPAGTRDYTLELSKAGGRFAGRFLHEDGTRPLYQGILLHKGANRGGFGFFLSAGPDIRSGTVTLDPDGP
jgi:hypothetical protein